MDDGCSVVKRPMLSDDEEPSAVQMGVPASALVERILDNFDVWECIFAFMGIRKRIQVEMMNKRLRSVMLALWARETSFDTASVFKELMGDPEKRPDGVLAICGRIGNRLRSLKLSDALALDWSNDLSSISNVCPNIESIHFRVEARSTHFHFKYNYFEVPSDLRFDMFVSLKDLSFSSSAADVDRELDWVCAPACVFLSIPSSIERIDRLRGITINHAQFETGQQLEQFFASRPSLRSIRLSGLCRTLDGSKADIFRVISQQCPLLKKVHLWESDAIDVHGLVSLESMEEIRFRSDNLLADPLTDAEMIEICKRNPLIEVLALKGFPCEWGLGLSTLCAVAALRNLRELFISLRDMPEAQVTKCVCQLASYSCASLRRLRLEYPCRLSTAATEALGTKCTKLRYLCFTVSVTDATPASIRHLIDCLVADPCWSTPDGNAEGLKIDVFVFASIEAVAFAQFKALTGPAANLPEGVNLRICGY